MTTVLSANDNIMTGEKCLLTRCRRINTDKYCSRISAQNDSGITWNEIPPARWGNLNWQKNRVNYLHVRLFYAAIDLSKQELKTNTKFYHDQIDE